MTMTLALTPNEFFKAWVSGLVINGERAIDPDRPATRRALDAVLKYLEREVENSEQSGDFNLEYCLLDLRNQFLPSNSGAFDGVERALRNLQTSVVMSPNPDYEEMILEVPKTFAEGVMASLPRDGKDLVEGAVRAYLGVKMASDGVPH